MHLISCLNLAFQVFLGKKIASMVATTPIVPFRTIREPARGILKLNAPPNDYVLPACIAVDWGLCPSVGALLVSIDF